jgi:hypothetical protein
MVIINRNGMKMGNQLEIFLEKKIKYFFFIFVGFENVPR